MAEAAKIRDVAARHAYVFDNGLCSPDFFDVDKRMISEEFGLLRDRIIPSDTVLEIGCFTGLNLLGLVKCGHLGDMTGVDFVSGALRWCEANNTRHHPIRLIGDYIADVNTYEHDSIICFDVLEHQRNVGDFLDDVLYLMAPGGHALFLVPIGKEYNDCGHVAWFPDTECLRNVLDYVFDVEEIFELKTCRKMFAKCRRRA